jgi:hypothetical protein
MDSHVWRVVYQAIGRADKVVPRFGRRPQYSDVLIVAIYLWSVAPDRPLCWACDRDHYGGCFRPRKLPSVSQFCRRIQTERCRVLLEHVHAMLARVDEVADLSFLDGRALRVGSHSKDEDAQRGRAGGSFARGYRLHAWATGDGRIPLWSVTPLNVNEKRVAAELVQFGRLSELVLADAGYDSGPLYDAFAERGMYLLTPMFRPNPGGGHHPSAARLAAAEAWQGVAGYVYRQRTAIERFFGQQGTTGGGLGSLPGWVRTLGRVRRWVGAKLILYHARLLVRQSAA